jgi:predicted AAA+ superfamily ATPase
MLKRSLDNELIKWKKSSFRQPLLVRGARQVGKTFSIQRFGSKYFNNCVTLNFEEQPESAACFETLNVTEILEKISILKSVQITPGKTLLFMDEIQSCPESIVSLRYFYEKMPELHVIGAGSLLEFALRSSDFKMPVGRISSLYMEPLSFAEFLDAQGHENLIKYLDQVDIYTKLENLYKDILEKILKKYLLVGGMPAVVSAYVEGASPEEIKMLQSSILQTYQADFAKYATTSKHKYLKDVFLAAPRVVGKQCKYSYINPHVQSRFLKDALGLLSDARCLHQIFHSSGHGIPLEAQLNPKKFKILFIDVGLMQRSLGLDTKLMFEKDIMIVNRGSVAEQYIGQQILTTSDFFEEKHLHYWSRESRSSQAEVDFLAVLEDKVLPVEVKAGKTGSLRSMHLFLNEHPESPFGIRFSPHEFSWHDNVLSIPLYMAGHWKRLAREVIRY